MRNNKHHLLFCDSASNQQIILGAGETRHAVSVLRVRINDTVSITDGKGSIYTACIDVIDRDSISCHILETCRIPRLLPDISMFIGLGERDSFETALSLVIPLGVSSVIPVVCQYCQDRWWEKYWAKHSERLNRIMITGIKQCLSAWLPVIHEPQSFEKALLLSTGTIVYCNSEGNRINELADSFRQADNISCFIGPPGGLTNNEINALITSGACSLKLGPFRLRTELAAAASMAAIRQIV
jgi:16S rRNA (uracil1498-N3)-methyltransferase